MGGVIDESQNNYYNFDKELSKVEFYIHAPRPNDFSLINRDKFYPLVVKEIEKYFTNNGVNAKWIGPVDGGGGGMESLIEIIKNVWENKDIFEFIIAFFGFFKNQLINIATKSVNHNKITLDIGLSIHCDSNSGNVSKADLDFLLREKMKNLLLISNDLADFISSKHGFMSINTNFEATIRAQNFMISFSLNSDQRKVINIARYLNIIDNSRIRVRKIIRYTVTKLLLIKREEGEIDFSGRSSISHGYKNFYFIFSSRLLKEFIKDTKDSIFSQI
ncbi:hypothetical protein KBC79_00035 [Candidatus Woesebacteria bacterium]|nr:hypothetical protein [Candidatus Woesebacteria bacterium]